MENIQNAIKDKYYRYNPGEFLPIYSGGVMLNKREFHKYRIKQIMRDPSGALQYFTHFSSQAV